MRDGYLQGIEAIVWRQQRVLRKATMIASSSADKPAASEAVFSPKGPRRLSFTNAMHRAFTNARFKRLGLLPMAKLVDAQSAEPPRYGPVCPVSLAAQFFSSLLD